MRDEHGELVEATIYPEGTARQAADPLPDDEVFPLEEAMPCSVCGDTIPAGTDAATVICSCCYGVICEKHPANPSCPHKPEDHDA